MIAVLWARVENSKRLRRAIRYLRRAIRREARLHLRKARQRDIRYLRRVIRREARLRHLRKARQRVVRSRLASLEKRFFLCRCEGVTLAR